ncbi:tRNA-splicing endonuclease subunit Sen15 [Annulohypoxylon maeteangense]|uniref:tRNA-splicing endonuclease subunit Sen15 n=1 Tax=Annulohypoxylon maeteangense TaxID=1927788 RepID=UPI0020079464|nr:tRNA-splicing endonuclease subunit Sen15 [Annulohypoxylon maeteangense]KAI0881903.1 tRNA-splicing endonuclease subunit Sen15 [Annulohypoxylon maeteangense]
MAEKSYFEHLAASVLDNLRYQHDWTELQILTHSPVDNSPLPRPMVSGLPPRQLYLHPDDQIEMLKSNPDLAGRIPGKPVVEWVLPTHLAEKWTLKAFASVFDSMPPQPSANADRVKRVLLATMHDDSTIVYYFMHDGIVKPRQN